jgi:hypothetical protein
VPAINNKYVNAITYDQVEPITHQEYDNKIIIDNTYYNKRKEIEMLTVCSVEELSHHQMQELGVCFPSNFAGAKYSCSNTMAIHLIEIATGIELSYQKLKMELYMEYKKFSNYTEQLIDIMNLEGKKQFIEKVVRNKIEIEDSIFMDNYYFTTMDLWILFEKYKIPSIFISKKRMIQSKFQDNMFVGYEKENVSLFAENKYIIIVVSDIVKNKSPYFTVIENSKKEIFISLYELNAYSYIDENGNPHNCPLNAKLSDTNIHSIYLNIRDFLRTFTSKNNPESYRSTSIPTMSHQIDEYNSYSDIDSDNKRTEAIKQLNKNPLDVIISADINIPRGRPRKHIVTLNNDKIQIPLRPRGRPKKQIIIEDKDIQQFNPTI